MLKRNLLLFIAVAAALFANHCKKKPVAGREALQGSANQPVATGYAVKSAIAIQDVPSLRGKAIGTLPIGNKVAIFATRVPDQKEPEKVFWYKIQYAPLGAAGDKPQMPVEGFIPEREEMIRENFLVFEKRTETTWTKEISADKTEEVKEPLTVMATTSVNLRRTPALNGQKIRVLKNGEVLSVLEQSTRSVKADGKYGAWYLLKDEQGESGYAFGGFLLEGGQSEMNELKEAGFQFASGWLIPLGGDARIYAGATGAARINPETVHYTKREPWAATKGNLEKDVYLKADGYTTKGNSLRYRFVISQPEAGADRYYFVDKKKVKFFKDFFTVSKAQPHKFDEQLAVDVNRFAGGDVNLQCSTATEFSAGGETPRKFLAIDVRFGPNEGDAEHCYTSSRRILFSEVGEGNRVFYESPVSYGEFVDLDGDQVPELVSQEHRRGGWSLDIFALKPNKVVPLLSLTGDGDGGLSHAEMQEKLVMIHGPFNCGDNMEEEQKKLCRKDTAEAKAKYSMLKFDKSMPPFPFYGKLENGKFVQVAAPKT
jgi:Bacterial SH3 domain